MSLLDVLGYLDWITPALSLVQDVHTFSVPQDRATEAIRKLEGAGIRMKNTSFLPGKFVFDVKPKDAEKVKELMEGRKGHGRRKPSEPPLILEWTCAYCGQRNPGSAYRCQGCGHQ